ncbi:MAG TPA: DUF4194 domain-containing protein [Ktedonobacterales bacterium]|nr:DUF4194 domain-containing protein [Ktedonobacterales bacterium]
MPSNAIAPYAPVILKLLQSPLYHDDAAAWTLLLTHLAAIQDYFARIGLEIHVHETEGFAFLHQPELEDDDGQRIVLPRLTRRDKLSYPVTLLCILLREQLDLFDASMPDSDRLILTRDQMTDLLRPFLREYTDERVLMQRITALLGRVVDLSFLRPITSTSEERYEVRRILKAKIDSEKLAEIRRKVQLYAPVET